MTDSEFQQKKAHRCEDGWLYYLQHSSTSTGTEMSLSVFVPPQAETQKVPVLYWLSGLTCTEENFMAKAGAQRFAARHGLMLVAPDTSPRGLHLPQEEDDWDLGTGAGFYVDATQKPWAGHYSMFSYIVDELPTKIEAHFPALPGRRSIFGHSMGGHGALVIAARHPERYQSVSAFAPICAPMQCPWGQKAFQHYLGDNTEDWAAYDASVLLQKADNPLPMLVDQGTADSFLEGQLKPEILAQICEERGHSLTLRMQEGYDHSYYFIASFMEDHIAYHAEALATS